MMTTYTWSVTDLQRNNDADSGVISASWTVTAINGEHQVSMSGTHGFTPDPSSPDYIAYDSLTEATVVSWIQGMIGADGVQATQEMLDEKLVEVMNPTTLAGTPW